MPTSSRLAAHRARSPEIKASSTVIVETDDEDLPDDDEDQSEGTEEKDQYMTEEEHKAALETATAEAKAEGEKQGFEAANKRINEVTGSDHYAGNEKLAATLLSKPGLSASDIIESLEASGGKPEQKPEAEDEEEKKEQEARENMRENLAASQPKSTGEEGGGDDLNAEDNSLAENMKARFEGAK